MKFKSFIAALAITLSTALSAATMPESISITYVKSPFNLQNIVMKERGMLEDAFKAEGVSMPRALLIRRRSLRSSASPARTIL